MAVDIRTFPSILAHNLEEVATGLRFSKRDLPAVGHFWNAKVGGRSSC